MSQVGISRPGTQQAGGRLSGVGPLLPEIQHPLSRMSNPDNLDVRGSASRAGSAFDLRPPTQSGRPLAAENLYPTSRRGSGMGGRIPSRLSVTRDGGLGKGPGQYEVIPEGIEVVHGDPGKTRLPLFGARAEIASRAESRAMSRLSTVSAQNRLEIDEIEAILKEKVKANYFEVRKRFKDNDPEGKGNVSRDGLFRILVTVLGRPLSSTQHNRLMERLGLADRGIINFTDFFAVFREAQSAEYPKWMDPIQRSYTDKAAMTAVQVHAHLKDKARSRAIDLADLMPNCNSDPSGRVVKPEFQSTIAKLGFHMEPQEFDKLWNRYDTEAVGAVTGEKLMTKLGVTVQEPQSPMKPPLMEPGTPMSSRPLKKKEAERQRSLNIERWMKNKFREGFANMRASFEGFDHDNTGFVSVSEFLEVLAEYGLRLEKPHLGEFLARCQMDATPVGICYHDFLHKFLDRSEGGMTHHILTNPKHRYNRSESPGNNSTVSALETEIMNMFQRDFLSLLGTFHKIDKLGTDLISQEEFRAAIESRFSLDMDEMQFRALIDRVPLSEDGCVRYADFMAQFDTKGRAASLFGGEKSRPKYKSIGALPADPSPPPPKSKREAPLVPAAHPPSPIRMDDGTMIEVVPHRSTHELFKIIKDLLKQNYQTVQETFQELDEWNSKRLSQEMMFQLLKRFSVTPEITRGEIRDLWKTFITNQDKSLDFQQFTRHFGFSVKSASYPNSKVRPPQRGDADFMIRSRKLNCAGDMLQDSLRAKIDYMWEDLRREFHAMDPYKTGLVSTEEFREVLTELCVHLSEHELEAITTRFDVHRDNRVSYLEFLKPFAGKKPVWRHGNNMLSLLQQPNAALPLADIAEPPQKGLHGITAKLRQSLAGDWKKLRRAFRKLDLNNEGYLSVPEFRSVLKLANVILDEDEVYHVMSRFDENVSGKIPYTQFLNEMMNPNPRAMPTRKSANI